MSKRILRVNQLMREEVGKIIAREMEFGRDIFCTVTRAETLPNLQQTKIYVSVVPDAAAKKVLEELRRAVFHIQQQVNKKFSMRPVPKIVFVEEKKTREAANVEKLLDSISPHHVQ